MKFTELTTEEQVNNLIQHHNRESEYVCLDLETTGLDPFTDTIKDIVLTGYTLDEACVFTSDYTLLLRDLTKPVVAHNAKFDFNFLFRAGVDLRISGLHADTLLLDHLLDENQEHGLDAIVQRRYADNYKEVFWNTYQTFEEAPRHAQLEYACKDVIYTGRVYRDTINDLNACGVPSSLILHVKRLALTLYDTELTGIKLDLPYLDKMGEELTRKISSLKVDMRAQVDLQCHIIENEQYLDDLESKKTTRGKANVKKTEFNFDSSQQLGVLLYERLRLPIQLNKKRNRTVDDAALEHIEGSHPVIPLVREYRGLQKVYTAFIAGSLEKLKSGRIHPTFNVNGTVTGRLSSSQPNMQQLPKDGGVRGIYVPDSGYKLISCDYSQLEVVVAAAFSQDPNLLRIVREGVSKHDITNESLKLNDRNLAKTLNFAMQYLCGWQKVQKLMGCSEAEAKYYWNKYWETYSKERIVVDECINRVKNSQPIVNPWGRHRRFPKFEDMGYWDREKCYRQAYNAYIQGTGSDCTSWSLYTCDDRLRRLGIGKALFSVHDELIVSAREDKIEEVKSVIIDTMVEAGRVINLALPLSVDCSNGMHRWQKN